MKRKLIGIFFILIVTAVFMYNYLNKEHRNIAKEDVGAVFESHDFYKTYMENNKEFNAIYLDKVIQLEGVISSLESNGVIFDNKNYVVFKEGMPNNLDIDTQIIIKGRYVGYDDLLDQLKIDQAILITN